MREYLVFLGLLILSATYYVSLKGVRTELISIRVGIDQLFKKLAVIFPEHEEIEVRKTNGRREARF